MAIEDFAAQFSADLDRAIQYAMENDVASAVRVSLAEAVETEVYDAYDPHMYIRRGPMDGGLQDQSPDNMEATYDPQTRTLEVQDMSRDEKTGRLVAPVVESGEGYRFPWDGQRPRPFHKRAQEIVVESGWFESALQAGLKAAGFDVK